MSTEVRAVYQWPVPPSLSPEVARFINKTVSLRFMGRDLSFGLSHGLFSSFDIDEGTRLLLKSLAQQVDVPSVGSALDVGCGVGVIGACIAAAAPGAMVTMQDRDALAVAVARENCRRNGITRITAECTLAFQGLGGRRFDLVTSNLPAKAGAPVLAAVLRHAAGCLSPGGTAAVVVVAPLAASIRRTIDSLGCPLAHVEETRAYSVFHFRAGAIAPETNVQQEDISPYIRGRETFRHGATEYALETAFALPDFDTRGRVTDLCLDLLDRTPSGSACFWNPGQGHLPVALSVLGGSALSSIVLAGRDCLECRVAERNLALAGRPAAQVHLMHSEQELAVTLAPGAVDLLVAIPHPIPRCPWQDDLVRAGLLLLRTGGHLVVGGSSTEIHRLLERAGGFSLLAGKKREGSRAALLRKRETTPPSQG